MASKKIYPFIICLAPLLIACNNQIHITNVKEFYFQKCSSCHTAYWSINGKTSIEDFNKMESAYLLNKLENIKTLKGHNQLFTELKYSKEDSKLIYGYIKDFFGVRN